MNKENLLKMADHLESGKVGKFDMRAYCDCVIGQSLRLIENRTGNFNYQWVQGSTRRMFGIDPSTPTSDFCFGATWPNDPRLAAERLRYVAQHGDAPSGDQWHRFAGWPVKENPAELQPEEIDEVDEYEEALC